MMWKALLLSLGSLYSLNASPKPLNVVLILADDLGYGEVGCYGQQKIKTPHIDQLASEGVKMTQAYSGAPVNTQSRFNVGGVDSTFFNSCAGYRGYKGSLYEGGIRVPFIAKLPGNIKPGTESDYPIYFPDIFPTLADAAKLMIPDQLDGVTIWPALLGQKMNPRTKPMVWIFPEYNGQAAVRWGDYKAVRMNLDKGPSSWEIFNIVQDPKETQNIARAKPELKAKLKAILEAEWGENIIF